MSDTTPPAPLKPEEVLALLARRPDEPEDDWIKRCRDLGFTVEDAQAPMWRATIDDMRDPTLKDYQ